MVKVLLHGCNGRMGHMISSLAADNGIEIVCGVDAFGEPTGKYPVYPELSGVTEDVDVVIDFSTARAMDALLAWCAENKKPVVLCTTGLSEEQQEKVLETAKVVGVVKSANMSLGINTLLALVKTAAGILAERGFDVEILEKHHNQKIDAPSGTALMLAEAVNEALTEKYDYVYDRSTRREKRPKKEIGISAVRGGSIVGDHEVIFAGTDEVVTISHSAYSRAVFGKGAISAAIFLAGKKEAGLYTMSDVIGV